MRNAVSAMTSFEDGGGQSAASRVQNRSWVTLSKEIGTSVYYLHGANSASHPTGLGAHSSLESLGRNVALPAP
jgi:hypothetical protein